VVLEASIAMSHAVSDANDSNDCRIEHDKASKCIQRVYSLTAGSAQDDILEWRITLTDGMPTAVEFTNLCFLIPT
jgi:hypothetical protein